MCDTSEERVTFIKLFDQLLNESNLLEILYKFYVNPIYLIDDIMVFDIAIYPSDHGTDDLMSLCYDRLMKNEIKIIDNTVKECCMILILSNQIKIKIFTDINFMHIANDEYKTYIKYNQKQFMQDLMLRHCDIEIKKIKDKKMNILANKF